MLLTAAPICVMEKGENANSMRVEAWQFVLANARTLIAGSSRFVWNDAVG